MCLILHLILVFCREIVGVGRITSALFSCLPPSFLLLSLGSCGRREGGVLGVGSGVIFQGELPLFMTHNNFIHLLMATCLIYSDVFGFWSAVEGLGEGELPL